MDSIALIDLLITDGEYILAHGQKESRIQWSLRAEKTLSKVFGEDWKDFVTWEDDKVRWEYADAVQVHKNWMSRLISYIKNARTLLKNMGEGTVQGSQEADSTNKSVPVQIFIVHGHDNMAKLELKNYLQSNLNLPEPIILHEKPSHGRTIIEKFEDYANNATLAFVLLTPDDVSAQPDDSNSKKYRARQNVIFEMGYFLGLFGRKEGRVILLYKGTLEIPSDISGLVYVDISNGIEASGEQIRKEIASFLSKAT